MTPPLDAVDADRDVFRLGRSKPFGYDGAKRAVDADCGVRERRVKLVEQRLHNA
jgi:hypothetical protein